MIKKFLNHPLFSGSLVMVGGSMIMNGVNYLYHVIMGRILGPVEYGILASLYSVIYLVGIIPTSSSVAIVKFISSAKTKDETYSVYKTLERFVLKLAITASIILLILTPFLAEFLKVKDLWSVAAVAFVLFFLLITLINQATSQGILKFVGSVGPGLVSALIKLGLGLILVILGWSVFGAMIGVVIGMFFAYLYSYFFLKKHIKKAKFKPFNLKPFFKFALPALLQALAFTSFFTVDVILAKHFLSAYDAGIYGALSTLGKIIFFAVSPVISTMFPIITARVSKKLPYKNILTASFLITLGTSSLIVLFYYLFPDLAIGILYGSAYLSATAELFLMGLFMLFYSLSFFWVNFSLSIGNINIVWVPLLISIIQIPALWAFHESIGEMIRVNLLLSVFLFLAIAAYLGYNNLKVKYEKR